MIITTTKTLRYTLELNAEEAQWLLGYMQNAKGKLSTEDAKDQSRRTEVFDNLRSAGVSL